MERKPAYAGCFFHLMRLKLQMSALCYCDKTVGLFLTATQYLAALTFREVVDERNMLCVCFIAPVAKPRRLIERHE
jgi:hypothetical protein